MISYWERKLSIVSWDMPDFLATMAMGPVGRWHFEVLLDHETSCFVGLLTTDPIYTLIGLVAL